MPSEDSGHAIDLGGHDGIPSVGGDWKFQEKLTSIPLLHIQCSFCDYVAF